MPITNGNEYAMMTIPVRRLEKLSIFERFTQNFPASFKSYRARGCQISRARVHAYTRARCDLTTRSPRGTMRSNLLLDLAPVYCRDKKTTRQRNVDPIGYFS